MNLAVAVASITVVLACHRSEPTPIDRCSPLASRMRDLAARGGSCSTDADCAFYPRIQTESDGGEWDRTAGVTDHATAALIEPIARQYTAAGCSPGIVSNAQTRRQKSIHITCERTMCLASTSF